jgi:hypothetical protein
MTDTVADSAATGHFFPNENNSTNKHNEIEVVCANNETMVSVETTELDIPELLSKAKTAYCFNASVPVLHAANSAYHQPTIAKLMAFHNATI